MKKSLPTFRRAALQALAVAGGLALAVPASAQTPVFAQWRLTANNADDAAVRSSNITAAPSTLRRLTLSDNMVPTGSGNQAFAPYSAAGQAFAVLANGGGWSSNATPPGPGSNPRRTFYQQFTVTATSAARVDSVLFNLSIFNTAAGKVAVAYSLSNFAADSASVTGGKGPAIMNNTITRAGGVLPAAENGSFGVGTSGNPGATANNAALLPQLPSTGTVPDQFRFALNGSTGVTLAAGQMLTLRIYVGAGSSSAGRYALLRNVTLKSLQTPTANKAQTVVKNGLTLAPNPAAERMLVNHPAAKAGARVAIYTATGQQVASQPTQAGTSGTTLDLSKLAAGFYLVEYADGEQRVTGRIVKQ